MSRLDPPPLIRTMSERKRFFSIDAFPNIDGIYEDNNDDDNLDKPRVTSATVIKPVNDGCLKNAALFSVTWPELDLPR